MYYYSKNSRKKIIHKGLCFHVANSYIDNIGCFDSLGQAYENGYRLCKHCNPLASRYRKELKSILAYSQEKGIAVEGRNRFIGITSISSKWKIILSVDQQQIRLYHKNAFETDNDALSPVSGYHLQRVYKNSIMGYLEYIVQHDQYRRENPLYIKPSKKPSPPPRKGTKRYKNAQKRAAQIARKDAIQNVLNIIDSFQFKSPKISDTLRANG